MNRNLQDLALMAVVRPLWDNYNFDQLQDYFASESFWMSGAIKFGSEIHKFGLPPVLETKLMPVVLEFGKRKFAKALQICTMKVPLERPSSAEKTLQEFLPASRPAYYFAGRKLRPMPNLQRLFPKSDQQMAIVTMLFALVQTNPRDDPSPIREFWNGAKFLRLQAKFLDKFPQIWLAVVHDLNNETSKYDFRGLSMMNSMVDSIDTCSLFGDNETIPWFVFEVLTDGQRDKFLALGRSSLLQNESFQYFFASIFKHWPWQNEAFDRYFGGREEFSDHELYVLRHLRKYQGWLENVAVNAGLLSKKVAFFNKLDDFLQGKRFSSGIGLDSKIS